MDKLLKKIKTLKLKSVKSIFIYQFYKKEILALVFDKMNYNDLIKAKKLLKKWEVIVFTTDDLKNGRDVFPIDFLNIKTSYQLLDGKDLIKRMRIDKKNLRAHLEYELRNKSIILRRHVLKEKDLKNFLFQIMPTMSQFLQSLLYLKDIDIKDLEIEDIINAVEKKYKINLRILKKLLKFEAKKIKVENKELISFYRDIGKCLVELTKIVNLI